MAIAAPRNPPSGVKTDAISGVSARCVNIEQQMTFDPKIWIVAFMEGFSMIITTLPVVFPVVIALGYDPIWFGVVITMLIEIAMISPPDGTVMYVLQGMRIRPGPITDVFIGVTPFVLIYIVGVFLMMLFPDIALWLPRILK